MVSETVGAKSKRAKAKNEEQAAQRFGIHGSLEDKMRGTSETPVRQTCISIAPRGLRERQSTSGLRDNRMNRYSERCGGSRRPSRAEHVYCNVSQGCATLALGYFPLLPTGGNNLADRVHRRKMTSLRGKNVPAITSARPLAGARYSYLSMRWARVPSALRTSTTSAKVPSACVAQLRHGSKERTRPSMRFNIPSVT